MDDLTANLRRRLSVLRGQDGGALFLTADEALRLVHAIDAAEDLCAAYEAGDARGGSVDWDAVDIAYQNAKAGTGRPI